MCGWNEENGEYQDNHYSPKDGYYLSLREFFVLKGTKAIKSSKAPLCTSHYGRLSSCVAQLWLSPFRNVAGDLIFGSRLATGTNVGSSHHSDATF